MEAPQTPQTPELENVARKAEPSQSVEALTTDLSPSQIVDQIAVLLQADTLPERKQIDGLRAAFYRRKEQAAQAGDAALSEQVEVQEERMNDLLKEYKELERKRTEALQATYEANAQAADELMKSLERLLERGEEGEEEFRNVYEEFHQIRQRWEALRPLSPQDESRLRKVFNPLRERFYDLKNINEELREYDFRKNLEAKRAIIEELRPLVDHTDPIYALRQMNDITSRWHDLGPVGKEYRAEISSTYKELSGAIYRRHQSFQDERRGAEQANLEAKEAIVARLETILAGPLPEKRRDWEELTETIKAMQAEWKTIGNAGRRDNDKVYQRLRKGMDAFFQLKSDFYTRTSNQLDENLAAKRALVEQAKELRESTDWERTAEELKALQAKWKEIGAVSQRHSQRVWTEFREHIDYFFDRRKAHSGGKHSQEREHLKAKRALIEELRTLQANPEVDNLQGKLRTISEAWKAIGHVPYSEKEAIGSTYKALMDELYDRLRGDRSQRRLEGYSASIRDLSSDKGALSAERQRMERIRERLRSELRAYDNNLNFLTLSSKGGSALLKDVERKRKELEEELRLLEEKIALLQAKG